MTRIIVLLLFFITITTSAYAAWTGPETILSFNYGTEELDIGIEHGDTESYVKSVIAIDPDGNLIVGDEINKKILIYKKSDRSMLKVTPKVPLGRNSWPLKIDYLSKGKIYVRSGYNHQVYDYEGNLISSFILDKTRGIPWDNGESLIIYDFKKKNYTKYSIHGVPAEEIPSNSDFLKTSFRGQAKFNVDDYIYKISLPDHTYSFDLPYRNIGRVTVRDDGILLIETDKKDPELISIDKCGNVLGSINFPDIVFGPEHENLPPGFDFPPQMLENHGRPIFGNDGNIYTWKQTPNNYSILKWIWVDEPDDPKSDCPKSSVP